MSRTRSVDADRAWREFVIDNGFRASSYELAYIIGRTVDDVERVRRTGVCVRREKCKEYPELFSLWHGRAPEDDEWPVPRKLPRLQTYEWQIRETAFLATLVGRLGMNEIIQVLSARLRKITGDKTAERNKNAIQTRINKIGLQVREVLGGLSPKQAGAEINSLAMVHQAIAKKQLKTERVGRNLVITRESWAEWKAKRTFPPKGYVPLASLKAPLAVKSDKLSEFARMGFVPTAIRCNPYGTKGKSTRFGTWFIDPKVAKKLVADRQAGKPMPWHGKPMLDNLRATYKRWQERQHPTECATCAQIWGKKGPPKDFEDYQHRYPLLGHGAKQHLTKPWSPGMTITEVVVYAKSTSYIVSQAITNGALPATEYKRKRYVSRPDATNWKNRGCPTGAHEKPWINLDTASRLYLFTRRELNRFIREKKLKTKTGTVGAAKGVIYVRRQDCARLREKQGFTLEEAARRVGVTVPRFKGLLDTVNWRNAKGISLKSVQAVIRRLQSRPEGYSLEEAAEACGKSLPWLREQLRTGVATVLRSRMDKRRVYVTEPMLRRLKHAAANPVKREKFSDDWLMQYDACAEAGVCVTTLISWATKGELKRTETVKGFRYHRKHVRACARRYWKTVRFHRAVPPAWLQAELEART